MSDVINSNNYMRDLIEKFPNNLSEALNISKQHPLKKEYPKFCNIVICGMGGSGIGGKLVSSWIQNEIDIPINFCQDYTLPKYVNNNTLIIASSNSGNTEETISSMIEADEKGATIIAVCSGGKLQSLCEKLNYEYIIVPGDNPPRTSLAFSIVLLTSIFGQLNLINKEKLKEFELAKELIISNKNDIHLEAKKLADFINSKELIIYSEAKYEAVAIRARQQFNENSKILCNHHTIPEMNHNELVGWYGGADHYAVLFLETDDWHKKNKKRLAFSINTIKNKTNNIKSIYSKGETILIKSLYLINIIDWASLYLAEKNNIDSVYIAVIDSLKNTLKN